jgi:hypothetical protein
MSPRPSDSMQQQEELSLVHAMNAADSVRRHFHAARETPGTNGSTSNVFAPSIPPGIPQGLAGFLVVGAALLPIRRLVLTHPSVNSHQAFRNFVDLVASVGHALVATQAALIAGSIYGGKTYLDEFAKQKSALRDQTSSSSILLDSICQDLNNNVVPRGTIRWPTGMDPKSIDPRVQTLLSMVRVMETCQSKGDNNAE